MGAQKVALVNESFVRKFNLGKDAVGKFMGSRSADTLDIQIVGVVKDARYGTVRDSIRPVYFLPWRQDEDASYMSFLVKSSLPTDQLLRAVPATMKNIDPMLPVEELKTVPQAIKESVFLDRMFSILTTAFALLATLLAGVGLYGVLAYSVAQRTREIGIRMALGADSWRVQRVVMRQVGVMLLVGGVIGVVAALGIGQVVQSLLFGMQGRDPFVFVLAAFVLAAIALMAGYLPARRASRIDPRHALRYD